MPQHVHHVIHVGTMQQTWEQDIVKAREIMRKANVDPADGFVLEALTRPNGDVSRDFQPDEDVDLREADRKFFGITPGGSGRS